ncbi:MAG: hypothetical protein JNL01_00275 [Bdellovibrionales bacterium]|nr:hypothetical protein [Bdellovibrionales bacterium]
MRSFLFLIPFWVLFSSPIAGSAGAWNVDLHTRDGQIDLLLSVIARHPDLPSSNLQFRRNLLDTIEKIPGILDHLGQDATPSAFLPSMVYSSEYTSSGTELKAKPELIEAVKTQLQDALAKLPELSLRSIAEDLKALKKAGGTVEKEWKALVSAYLKLLPYFYDGSGSSVFPNGLAASKQQLRELIQNETSGDLENRFADVYKKHQTSKLASITKEPELRFMEASLAVHLREFVEKTAIPATQLYSETGQKAATRFISLEEIPGIISALRGTLANDCSILSVPYYGLVKSSRVYWIRKDKDVEAKPSGYVFVSEVTLDGKTIPYIITINGPTLTSDDSLEVVRMVAELRGSDEVILSDFNVNNWLVNFGTIRTALKSIPGKEVQVTMPPGWKVVEDYQNRNAPAGYSNYYASSRVKSAIRSSVSDIRKMARKTSRSESIVRYTLAKDLEKIPALNRAITAANAAAKDAAGTRADALDLIRKRLKVTPEQHLLGQKIVDLSPLQPMNHELYQKLKTVFGYKPAQILNLDMATRAHSLRNIFESDRTEATDAEWTSIIRKANRELKKELDASIEEIRKNGIGRHQVPMQMALKAFLTLPDLFNESFVEEGLEFYRTEFDFVRREAILGLVTHASTEGNLGKLLEFISTRPDLYSGNTDLPLDSMIERARAFPSLAQSIYNFSLQRAHAVLQGDGGLNFQNWLRIYVSEIPRLNIQDQAEIRKRYLSQLAQTQTNTNGTRFQESLERFYEKNLLDQSAFFKLTPAERKGVIELLVEEVLIANGSYSRVVLALERYTSLLGHLSADEASEHPSLDQLKNKLFQKAQAGFSGDPGLNYENWADLYKTVYRKLSLLEQAKLLSAHPEHLAKTGHHCCGGPVVQEAFNQFANQYLVDLEAFRALTSEQKRYSLRVLENIIQLNESETRDISRSYTLYRRAWNELDSDLRDEVTSPDLLYAKLKEVATVRMAGNGGTNYVVWGEVFDHTFPALNLVDQLRFLKDSIPALLKARSHCCGGETIRKNYLEFMVFAEEKSAQWTIAERALLSELSIALSTGLSKLPDTGAIPLKLIQMNQALDCGAHLR